MIRSIRRFLLISLLVAITIASSVTAIGNYLLDEKIIQPYLDEQLIKIHAFIIKINRLSNTSNLAKSEIVEYLKSESTPHFIFQVWSPSGKLLIHSHSNINIILENIPEGFSDIEINNNDWRIYSGVDSYSHNKIIVGELYEIRNQLADLITRNNAYILLVTYPIYGILIWLIVGFSLRSVNRMTSEISNRASTYLEPVDDTNTPIEIKPLVAELNSLFIRLRLAFDRNKRFAGDAAHELRTPLAAIKTQVQVALKANNEPDRLQALAKVVQGVDRSSHVVAQLLTLSRLGQEEELNDIHPVDLYKLTVEMLTFLVPIALEKQIEIELSPPPARTVILGNDTALGILIRNIVDNAIRYTPENGSVTVTILNDHSHIILRVEDSGPGIPIELRERVFERFYRVLGTNASGSGLGLAIVSQIADLHHADIALNTPSNGIGLQFDVIFPVNKVKKEKNHGFI